MKVNLGCGQAYMDGWVNVDASPDVRADVYMDVVEFVQQHADDIEEVYLGHVIEHLLPGDSLVLLRLLCERLRPGSVISAVVPDMQAIFDAYKASEIDNRDLNEKFVYSYVQPSRHVWCYDEPSLKELFGQAGFEDIAYIDPASWPPVYWKEGPDAQWQCGVRALATGRASDAPSVPARPPTAERRIDDTRLAPTTAEKLLLQRLERLREELAREVTRREELRRRADEKEQAVAEMVPLRHQLEQIEASRTYAVAQRLRRVSERLAPLGSRKRAVAIAGVRTLRETKRFVRDLQRTWTIPGVIEPGEPSYARWAADHSATRGALRLQAEESRRARRPTTFGCVVFGEGDTEAIRATVDSLTEQSWRHWRAMLMSTGSRSLVGLDDRIESDHHGPSASSESGNLAVGRLDDVDFVIFLRAGDELAPDCLYQVAALATQDPLIDLIYWDDDLLLPDGTRAEPRFRPSWSPEILLSGNYLGWSFAVRRARFMMIGGFRPGFGDAASWDLVLRSGVDEERVARVPRVLSHVRARCDDADEAGRRAVADHLKSANLPGVATREGDRVRVRWRLEEAPRVTIVIPTRHNRDMLERCLPSLARTQYPEFDVVIVDNGARTADNERWYVEHFPNMNLTVEWWDRPFNYSAVNNLGASRATGEVLVFLNDDTEALDAGWLHELAGWVMQPAIGVVGLQLLAADGTLQHAGAILGLNGFADHLFEGMSPGSDSLLGPTDWYRNVIAVTGACLAIRREIFERVGGFDERFILCGSDVALGIDARIEGLRNLCSPFARVRHLESATRGTHVPAEDFFTSYWRYQSFIFGGDPYFSPHLSLGSRIPKLRSELEPTPAERVAVPLGRPFEVFRQKSDVAEATMFADTFRATERDIEAVHAGHAANRAPFDVETVNWFIPDIDSPFYGGILTALRIADQLVRNHGVENRFVVWGAGPEMFVRSALEAAFPALGASPIFFYDDLAETSLERIPPADAAIATLWVTAYGVAHFPYARRKFYLIQDFEPMFYPAGTMYALTEETYRFGLYGLCNTENLKKIYHKEYGGKGFNFMPAVDASVFHAEGRAERTPDAPATVFVYARPGHWRNCWELASVALGELKARLGDKVRIVTAGSWAIPEAGGLRDTIRHYGLLDYRATGPLYRRCDIGLALTVSKHPSYLPLELMASGVSVVAFDNPYGHWILRDGENCLLSERTVDSLADNLERLAVDPELRRRLSTRALDDIGRSHGSWEKALSDVHGFLCNPEGE